MRLAALAALGIPALLAQQSYFSVPAADAPELAPRGRYSVGVRTVRIVNPGQPDILHFDKDTGKAPLYDRPLTLEIWYPAVIPAGKEERDDYESAMPGTPQPAPPKHFAFRAKPCAMPHRSPAHHFRW